MEEDKDEKKVDAESGKEEKDLTELAKVEITKATISQAFGTMIFPLANEVATAQVKGITWVKEYFKNKNKVKLAEKHREKIESLIEEAHCDDKKLRDLTTVHSFLEKASEKEQDNSKVVELWNSVLERILKGEGDTDMLVEKLVALSTSEAEFLIEFNCGKHSNININPILATLSFSLKVDADKDRAQTLAKSLAEKDILVQKFPVVRAFLGLLLPVLALLLSAELGRDLFAANNVNVSSANNVILMAVLGVAIGLGFLPILKQKTELTWIGARLCERLPKKRVE